MCSVDMGAYGRAPCTAAACDPPEGCGAVKVGAGADGAVPAAASALGCANAPEIVPKATSAVRACRTAWMGRGMSGLGWRRIGEPGETGRRNRRFRDRGVTRSRRWSRRFLLEGSLDGRPKTVGGLSRPTSRNGALPAVPLERSCLCPRSGYARRGAAGALSQEFKDCESTSQGARSSAARRPGGEA